MLLRRRGIRGVNVVVNRSEMAYFNLYRLWGCSMLLLLGGSLPGLGRMAQP